MKDFYKGLLLGVLAYPLTNLVNSAFEAITNLTVSGANLKIIKLNDKIEEIQSSAEPTHTVAIGFQPPEECECEECDEEEYEE